jgi:hypothetical protein
VQAQRPFDGFITKKGAVALDDYHLSDSSLFMSQSKPVLTFILNQVRYEAYFK